ncbi:MAG: methyltransferase domain-containing protein [Gaiellaceae bacterium MAG52_C11]|nr:methyltransferase domain-containing protein [Candidatus Gaiellasilicea maunaloa]
MRALAELDVLPGASVLDAGCGAGVHLGLFAEAVGPTGRVAGIDLDPDEIALAEQLWEGTDVGAVLELGSGDLLELPFPDASFDLVWSAAALHHVEPVEQAFAELVRVTRSGGRVAVLEADVGGSFPFLPWPVELEIVLRSAALRAELDRYGGKLAYSFSGLLGRELPRLLREAGLEQIELLPVHEVEQGPLDAARADESRQWFLGPLAERIRPYLAPRDWELLERLLEPRVDGGLFASQDFFQVRTGYLVTGHVR